LILLFSKLVYYTLTIVVPVLVLDVSWQQFLLGFFIVHLWMSFLLSAVLIPVHLVDEATFAVVSGDGFIEDSWANHVVRNTTDYSAQNPLAGFLFGGLNTHLVHHLFPGVYHGHYRALSRILAETAGDFGLEYRNVTMWQAIVSHYRLLRRMSAA
jgi:linoleoyl-CoA desaturase